MAASVGMGELRKLEVGHLEILTSTSALAFKSLNTAAIFKKRIFRGKYKPHIKSLIRKEFMTRSRLKNKTNKCGKEEDLTAYKKQRNLVLKLIEKQRKTSSKVVSPLTIKWKITTFANPFFFRKGFAIQPKHYINWEKTRETDLPTDKTFFWK